jgi:hypothetical protein
MLNLPVKKNFCLKIFDKLRQLIFIEEFKQYVDSDIKTDIDEHKVSCSVESSTMADDYALTHTLIFLKNKSAGCVPNFNSFVQNTKCRFPSYNHFDKL